MKARRNHRWLRYGIRTLLVAVTLFCVWLGWQVSIVRERKAVLRLIGERDGNFAVYEPIKDDPTSPWYPGPTDEDYPPDLIPWYRLIMSDLHVWHIYTGSMSSVEVDRARRAFPEAEVITERNESLGPFDN